MPIHRQPRRERRIAAREGMTVNNGRSRWLTSMVDRVIDAMMIMLVAAEKPPMKTNSASQGLPWEIGMFRTYVSARLIGIPEIIPYNAIGTTKMLISSMYSGNCHIAGRMLRGDAF